MSDADEPAVRITSSNVDRILRNAREAAKKADLVDATAIDSIAFACAAATLDSYARALETATVAAPSEASETGAGAALRQAAHEARSMAESLRQQIPRT